MYIIHYSQVPNNRPHPLTRDQHFPDFARYPLLLWSLNSALTVPRLIILEKIPDTPFIYIIKYLRVRMPYVLK